MSGRSLPGCLIGSLAVALAGCVHLDPLPTAKPILPPAWSHQADPTGTRPKVDLTRWWTAFDDPTLDRLVQEVASENLSLQAAARRVAAARSSRDAAVAGLLPTLSGTGVVQAERTFGSGNQTVLPVGSPLGSPLGSPGVDVIGQPVVIGTQSAAYYQPGLDATWEVPLFGRGAATSRIADAALGAAAADQEAAQVRLVAEVARSYVILRADQQRHAILAATVAVEHRLAGLVGTRSGAGMASDLDLARARNAADQTATRLAPIDGEISEGLQKLATLRGRTAVDATLLAPSAVPRAPTAAIDVVPADLLRLRPDILQAGEDVEAKAGVLGIAVADLYPRLALVGSISAIGGLNGGPLSGPFGLVGGGPAVTIPLIDWGAHLAQAKARNAQLAASVLQYRQTVLDGVAEVETALAHVAAARSQVRSADHAVASAEQAFGYADLLYRQGLTPLTDLLDVERSLLDDRLERVASAQSEALAVIALYKAIGGRMPDDTSPAKD
jgi:NodT family efflux transporter outer membrane factor (OMF) lipoprotein